MARRYSNCADAAAASSSSPILEVTSAFCSSGGGGRDLADSLERSGGGEKGGLEEEDEETSLSSLWPLSPLVMLSPPSPSLSPSMLSRYLVGADFLLEDMAGEAVQKREKIKKKVGHHHK